MCVFTTIRSVSLDSPNRSSFFLDPFVIRSSHRLLGWSVCYRLDFGPGRHVPCFVFAFGMQRNISTSAIWSFVISLSNASTLPGNSFSYLVLFSVKIKLMCIDPKKKSKKTKTNKNKKQIRKESKGSVVYNISYLLIEPLWNSIQCSSNSSYLFFLGNII